MDHKPFNNNQGEIKPKGNTQEERILNAAHQYVEKCSDSEKGRLKKLADTVEKEACAPGGAQQHGGGKQMHQGDCAGGQNIHQGQGQGLHQGHGHGQGDCAGGQNIHQGQGHVHGQGDCAGDKNKKGQDCL